jgi:hypothetical protein
MPHGMFALLDMAIVGVPVIVISVWQLVSVNREIAKDREKRGSPEDARHPVGQHRLDDR